MDFTKIKRMHKRNRWKAYQRLLKANNQPDSLFYRINARIGLIAPEIHSATDLFGENCKRKTRSLLLLTFCTVPNIRNWMSYQHVQFENDSAKFNGNAKLLHKVRHLLLKR